MAYRNPASSLRPMVAHGSGRGFALPGQVLNLVGQGRFTRFQLLDLFATLLQFRFRSAVGFLARGQQRADRGQLLGQLRPRLFRFGHLPGRLPGGLLVAFRLGARTTAEALQFGGGETHQLLLLRQLGAQLRLRLAADRQLGREIVALLADDGSFLLGVFAAPGFRFQRLRERVESLLHRRPGGFQFLQIAEFDIECLGLRLERLLEPRELGPQLRLSLLARGQFSFQRAAFLADAGGLLFGGLVALFLRCQFLRQFLDLFVRGGSVGFQLLRLGGQLADLRIQPLLLLRQLGAQLGLRLVARRQGGFQRGLPFRQGGGFPLGAFAPFRLRAQGLRQLVDPLFCRRAARIRFPRLAGQLADLRLQ
jgi:hypothetical protein